MEDDHECEPPDPQLVEVHEQRISSMIREVLEERFPAHSPYMIMNWHFIVTAVDKDGERLLWAVAPEDARSWDILGMIEHAQQSHNLNMIKEMLGE